MSCGMENGGDTEEHLESTAVKVSNDTHGMDDIDWGVSKLDYLCLG